MRAARLDASDGDGDPAREDARRARLAALSGLAVLATVICALLVPSLASAAAPAAPAAPAVPATPKPPTPPSNDNHDNARLVSKLPTTFTGTTIGATLEPNEVSSECADQPTDNSVWY